MKESVIKKRSNMRFVPVNFQNKVKNHGFQICSNNRVHASVYEIFVFFFFFFCLKKNSFSTFLMIFSIHKNMNNTI